MPLAAAHLRHAPYLRYFRQRDGAISLHWGDTRSGSTRVHVPWFLRESTDQGTSSVVSMWHALNFSVAPRQLRPWLRRGLAAPRAQCLTAPPGTLPSGARIAPHDAPLLTAAGAECAGDSLRGVDAHAAWATGCRMTPAPPSGAFDRRGDVPQLLVSAVHLGQARRSEAICAEGYGLSRLVQVRPVPHANVHGVGACRRGRGADLRLPDSRIRELRVTVEL